MTQNRLQHLRESASSHWHLLDALLLLTTSIIVTILWYNNGNLALGGDFASVPFDPSHSAPKYLSAWNFWIDGGNPIPVAITNQVPSLDFLFYYSLSLLGLPLFAVQGSYIALFAYFLPALSTYSLVILLVRSRFTASRLAGFVAGIFTILNPIYVYSSGYPSILNSAIARASLPLGLFILLAGFRKWSLRYAVAFGLCSILMFGVFARATEFFFVMLIAGILGIPALISVVKSRNGRMVRFGFRFLIVSAVTAVGANLFWIVPFLQVYPLFYATLTTFPTSFVDFESKFTTVQNVIRLQGYWPFFVGDYVPYAAYFSNPVVFGITFAIPVVALAGLRAWKSNRGEFVAVVSLVGLLLSLSSGTNLPFGIFDTLINVVPFFKLFKDPWVFLEPLSLLYAILFGISIALLAGFLENRVKSRHLAKLVPFSLALILIGVISLPVLSGSVFINWYQPSQRGVNVPSEYAEVNQWLVRQNCECATMIIPRLSGSYLATTWGFQGPNELYQNLFSTSLVTGSGPPIYGLQPPSEKQLVDYTYGMMTNGDPLSSPIPVNGTSRLESWHYSVGSQALTDSLKTMPYETPWNQSTIEWNFGANPEGAQNGHSIYFTFNGTQDLSNQRWLVAWASSTAAWNSVSLGVGDDLGNIAWYPVSQHQLVVSGNWTLFGFPLGEPDVRLANITRTHAIFLNYGLFSGQQVASTGTGIINFGPIMLSSGQVSENFVEFLLGALNVGYLVVDKSIDPTLYPQLNLRPYSATLSTWTQIRMVKSYGGLIVYQIPNRGSLFYSPSTLANVYSIYSLPKEFNQFAGDPASLAFSIGGNNTFHYSLPRATVESVVQNGPTSFTLQIVSQGSFQLIMSTAFDAGWHASQKGGVLTHVRADEYANGWNVEGSGQITVQIEYDPQRGYDMALLLSPSSISGAFVALIPSKRMVLERLRGRWQNLRYLRSLNILGGSECVMVRTSPAFSKTVAGEDEKIV